MAQLDVQLYVRSPALVNKHTWKNIVKAAGLALTDLPTYEVISADPNHRTTGIAVPIKDAESIIIQQDSIGNHGGILPPGVGKSGTSVVTSQNYLNLRDGVVNLDGSIKNRTTYRKRRSEDGFPEPTGHGAALQLPFDETMYTNYQPPRDETQDMIDQNGDDQNGNGNGNQLQTRQAVIARHSSVLGDRKRRNTQLADLSEPPVSKRSKGDVIKSSYSQGVIFSSDASSTVIADLTITPVQNADVSLDTMFEQLPNKGAQPPADVFQTYTQVVEGGSKSIKEGLKGKILELWMGGQNLLSSLEYGNPTSNETWTPRRFSGLMYAYAVMCMYFFIKTTIGQTRPPAWDNIGPVNVIAGQSLLSDISQKILGWRSRLCAGWTWIRKQVEITHPGALFINQGSVWTWKMLLAWRFDMEDGIVRVVEEMPVTIEQLDDDVPFAQLLAGCLASAIISDLTKSKGKELLIAQMWSASPEICLYLTQEYRDYIRALCAEVEGSNKSYEISLQAINNELGIDMTGVADGTVLNVLEKEGTLKVDAPRTSKSKRLNNTPAGKNSLAAMLMKAIDPAQQD